MANEIDVNSLVYAYLMKKAPKCAELFCKSNKVVSFWIFSVLSKISRVQCFKLSNN